jgi:D-glycero-D-manno-heptose 1,7-bisphosphate phosphatase
MKAAVFFERDGILISPKIEAGTCLTPRTLEDVVLNEHAVRPLRELKAAGFLLFATTNQPGISRGYLLRREVDRIHDLLLRAFPLEDILMCPHDEMDHCPCRKPKPGLLREAAFKWQLSLEHSFVISQKWQDARAAHSAGCTSLLIQSPLNGNGHHDFILPSLEAAATRAIQLQQNYVALTESLSGNS